MCLCICREIYYLHLMFLYSIWYCWVLFKILLLFLDETFLCLSETRKMQRTARDNVRRILDEQEKLNYELESKKRKLDSWSKELNKREALTERERQKLDEDKKKVIYVIFLYY